MLSFSKTHSMDIISFLCTDDDGLGPPILTPEIAVRAIRDDPIQLIV
jgi:hypothetical protein